MRRTGRDRRLPRRVLPLARRQDLAEDHLVNLIGLDASALQSGLYRDLAQFVRRQGGEGAVERADGRSGGGRNDDGAQETSSDGVLAHEMPPGGRLSKRKPPSRTKL